MTFYVFLCYSQVWYVPFTYTIETSNSTKTSFTNIVDMDNLSEKIIWILANETKSKSI